MTVISIKEAYCILMSESKSNGSVARGLVKAGERAVPYTQDVRNLETSWPVRVSQTRTLKSCGDQHVKSSPSDEYVGE